MKYFFLKLMLVPIFVTMVACGASYNDNLPIDDTNSQIGTDDPVVEEPTPEPTPLPTPDPEGPEIAEENPCQGIPGGCGPVYKKFDPGILQIYQIGKTQKLKQALELHTAIVFAHKGYWLNASDYVKSLKYQMVEDAWDSFLGYNSLEALKADVEDYPKETLNKFLQFYRYTVFNGPDGNWYQSEFEVVGGMNLSAFNYLKSAMSKAKGYNSYGGANDLSKFTALLPKPNLVLQTAFMRISIESAANRFGLKEYFGKVSASDEKYEDLALDFFLPLAVDVLATFRNVGAAPGQEYKTCSSNPNCPDSVVDSYAVMVFELPKVWESVVFKMTDANGETRLFSFLNFVHVPSNGKMFGLARGTFGAHPIETLKFVKNGEI